MATRTEFKEIYRKSIYVKLCVILAFSLLAVILFFLSLSVGTRDLSIGQVYSILLEHISGSVYDPVLQYELWYDDNIVWNYRLPRALFAIIAGAGLSVAGATMQSVMKNPLADPYTTGISSGALLGVSLSLVLGFNVGSGGLDGYGTVINSMIFAMVPVGIIYMLSPIMKSPATLILAGTAVSYLFSSITSIILVTNSEESLTSVYQWQVGSFTDLSWDAIPIPFVVCLVGSVMLFLMSGKMNLMSLDDKDAKALGLDGEKLRLICLIVLSFMVSSIISFVGIIGFVGLIIPHVVRLTIGSDNRFVIPASVCIGAAFLLGCDIISRAIDVSSTVPVGVVTAFIGSPIFLYLIIRGKRDIW